MAIRLFYKMESEKEKNGTQADSCLAKTFCERVLENISHVLKDRQWVKWIGGGRGGVPKCVYEGENESLEGKWGEEWNWEGGSNATNRELGIEREGDGDGKPERAQMRELRWWAGSFQAPGCFSGLSSTLWGIVWNAQADGWHLSHESSMSGHCPLRSPRTHTPLHKCVCARWRVTDRPWPISMAGMKKGEAKSRRPAVNSVSHQCISVSGTLLMQLNITAGARVHTHHTHTHTPTGVIAQLSHRCRMFSPLLLPSYCSPAPFCNLFF